MALAKWIRGAGMVVMSGVGHLPSVVVRRFLYRRLFRMKMARGAVVYRRCEIWAPRQVELGPRAIVGQDCFLDGRRGITIGADAALSSEVMIWTLEHDPQDPDFGCRGGPVAIGARAWIGARAIILPDPEIGEGAVVAAGAVVTRNVEPFTIVGGVPAKKIGERTRELRYEHSGTMPFV